MRYRLSVLTLLLPILLFAIEPAKVSFKCNIHTINMMEGQTEGEPLDGEFGGTVSLKSRSIRTNKLDIWG